PWGRGRPGWHIECSAMSSKYLGESFDIHTGGIDNIFPHHEDEIAQSEAASGKTFVKYWMHCAHLIVDGRKMAKSLGNFYTLRDIVEKGFTGREIRYVLISAHYRQSLNFTFHGLESARASLSRLDDFRERLLEASGGKSPDAAAGLPKWAVAGMKGFIKAMNDDLNMPEGLAAVFGMVHEGNRALDSGLEWEHAGGALDVLDDIDRVLGVFKKGGETADDEVASLVDARESARVAGNWSEADRLREVITGMGWELRDTADGPKLKRI
ncbi:MAG: cysteine--tRNA ligase, partial [Lentisphaerae bacterium]|nr:cysteine--tRNA ligase [Lentisphaerota bacterium]